jgi:hypothetical protein
MLPAAPTGKLSWWSASKLSEWSIQTMFVRNDALMNGLKWSISKPNWTGQSSAVPQIIHSERCWQHQRQSNSLRIKSESKNWQGEVRMGKAEFDQCCSAYLFVKDNFHIQYRELHLLICYSYRNWGDEHVLVKCNMQIIISKSGRKWTFARNKKPLRYISNMI